MDARCLAPETRRVDSVESRCEHYRQVPRACKWQNLWVPKTATQQVILWICSGCNADWWSINQWESKPRVCLTLHIYYMANCWLVARISNLQGGPWTSNNDIGSTIFLCKCMDGRMAVWNCNWENTFCLHLVVAVCNHIYRIHICQHWCVIHFQEYPM